MPRTARSQPGCHECSKRRIRCDLGTPSCVKCLRKGIECSGQTKYRFNVGVANRGHLKGFKYPVKERSSQKSVIQVPGLQWQASESPKQDRNATPSETADQQVACTSSWRDLTLMHTSEAAPRLARQVNILPTGVSLLFDHFSTVICPHMVIFDHNNGWRDLILPLAVDNELVQRAVCVTAAQHLTLRRPDSRRRVETQRLKVLTQLHEEAITEKALTRAGAVAACVALLVLLVGETVTGGADFQQLHKSLQLFSSAARLEQLLGHDTTWKSFLMQQAQLFTAFSRPMDDVVCRDLMRPCFEEQFHFIATQPTADERESQNLEAINAALRIAYRLHLASLEVREGIESTNLVRDLVAVCHTVPSGAAGEHALVWAYFVGAAETKRMDYRNFFVSRMEAVYQRAGFDNITAAINLLRRLWSYNPDTPWASLLPREQPVLVM